MKVVKVFLLFAVIHIAGWAAAHWYFDKNRSDVLLVVDTSYSMKERFPSVDAWIENYTSSARYKNIRVGTDKALLGKFEELKSRNVIYRTAFGRMSAESLQRYDSIAADKKILLSDGSIKPDGWDVVVF